MTPERRRAPRPEPVQEGGGAEETIAAALSARRPGEVTGVLVLGLDRADLLADAYGVALVDDLLADVAGRLRLTIRADDRLLPAGRGALCLVARSMPGQRDVALLAERVVRAAARPLALPDGVEHEVTLSVGASVGRGDDQPDALLARAERRCRRVATAGGGRWSVEGVGSDVGSLSASDPDRTVRDDAVARLRQAGELRQALAAGQLDLALTPLTALTPPAPDSFTPAVAGEGVDPAGEWRVVAVRWRHPVRGLLHPGAVVAAVVDAGLGGAYLDTVLRLASAAAVDASVAAGRPVGAAVDLPLAVVAQARAQAVDLTGLVAGAVARARLEPAQLALRITADDAGVGAQVLAPALERLAGLGVAVMLTGIDPSPSTLAALDTWPQASIWLLDRSVPIALVVPSSAREPGAARVPTELAPTVVLARTGVAAVVAAARARGIVTGAEGVDEPAVAAELLAAGVSLAQGRWAARPAAPATAG